ncbi:MAG: succinyl-diaminopimelate desuccinylase [Campylobacteraceae bacterium]
MTTKELFLKLLGAPSITPNDAGLLDFIAEYMDEFEVKRIDINGVKNLFLSKTFGAGIHLCFAGHVDVVPAGENWESDPFVPIEKDGYIYARGAQDMKSGVCAFLHACKNAKDFNGTLSILLTSDEEGDAKYGTIEVLKYLKEQNNLPSFAVVAEPTCEKSFGDAIKIGRRGSINGVITLKGIQGHAAYPEKSKNPIHEIAPILSKIAGHDFDKGDEFFSPSKLVITDIRSGYEVTNLTPNSLKLMFNVRNSTKTSKEDIKNFIDDSFIGLEYELKLFPSAKPFMTEKNSQIVTNIQKSILEVTCKETKLSTAGGTSDARFFGEFGVSTVEFGVVNDTIHSANERCALKEVLDLEKVFSDLIKRF